jgi:hypothetical protein
MFLTFDPETRAVTMSADVAHADDYRKMLTDEGYHFIETLDFNRNIDDVWVTPDLQLTDKQRIEAPHQVTIRADDQDAFRVAGLPAGTRVFVNDVDHGVLDDGVLEVTSPVAAFYHIRLQAVGHYDKEITVEAVAQ